MALSKNAKIALWGCGSISFVGIGLIVAVGVYIAANKDAITDSAKQGDEEGRAFGAAHTQHECVEESVKRNSACAGMFCEAGVNIFADSCLRAAPAEASTCDGAPGPAEIFKLVTWEKDRCTAMGRPGSEPCRRLMQSVASYCAKASTSSK